ncbi:MAG: TonB family protein [Terriglobales bacterium]|jgi:TonB family protein
MGYQALLFCPDEKLARVVSQVFTELDFTVEPVHEPFAAVKQLMAQRYDALVVDCGDDQNASLLFKSARNSSSNQNSLAIALVEGQTGVAKAYRIGANLLLTKPINLEQAKGTLRVARGLLRKNSDAAAASAATSAMPARTASVSAGSSSQPASPEAAAIAQPANRPEISASQAPLAASIPAAIPAELPAMAASAKIEDKPAVVPAPALQTAVTVATQPVVEARQTAAAAVVNSGVVKSDVVKNDTIKSDAAKNDAANIAGAAVLAQNPGSIFTLASGSAAAPAPAKEVTAPPAKENKTVELEPAKPAPDKPFSYKPTSDKPTSGIALHDAAPESAATLSLPRVSDAPSFGALDERDSGGSGGSKKILIAAGVVLVLAALGYLGYGKLAKPSAPQAASALHAGQPAAALGTSPVPTPATTPGHASAAYQAVASKTAATPGKLAVGEGISPAMAKKTDAAPTLVKPAATEKTTQTQAEESAPPLTIASADDSNLTGLMSSAASSVPKLSLTTLRISQGVSQGLLIKRVQPQYPRAAVAIHAEGTVQIEATIGKEGSVTNVKVLSGEAILARAAVEAVRQWRYKPYYLDGAPVEIQTQITINFKAN